MNCLLNEFLNFSKNFFGRFVSLTRDDLKISFRFLSLSHYQCLSQLRSHSVFLLQIQNIPIQNILILIYLQLFNNLNNFRSLTFALLIVSWFPLRSTAFTVIIRWFSSHCMVSFGIFDITVKNFLFENVEFAFIIYPFSTIHAKLILKIIILFKHLLQFTKIVSGGGLFFEGFLFDGQGILYNF